LLRLEGPGCHLVRLSVEFIDPDGIPVKHSIKADALERAMGRGRSQDGPAT
jgi:hypothetical protein